jgi:6-phosphofructokinase 2
LRAADGDSFIVASGSLAPGVPDDAYAGLARAGKRAGQRIVVDVSGPPLRLALEAGVYLVKPNLRELQDLLGVRLEDRTSQVEACRKLIHSGASEIIALSLGSQGALLVTREAAWFSEPLAVRVQSSVGAGDSFLGGLLWSLSQKRDLPAALAFAVAAGSAALLAPGTQLCRPDDVQRLLADVRLTELQAA